MFTRLLWRIKRTIMSGETSGKRANDRHVWRSWEWILRFCKNRHRTGGNIAVGILSTYFSFQLYEKKRSHGQRSGGVASHNMRQRASEVSKGGWKRWKRPPERSHDSFRPGTQWLLVISDPSLVRRKLSATCCSASDFIRFFVIILSLRYFLQTSYHLQIIEASLLGCYK